MTATDLGWIATVTADCQTHRSSETWGVKGATKTLALQGIEEARAGIHQAHSLAHWTPVAGKIFSMPTPEPDPVEQAATAVWAELEHLSREDRLTVLRQAISAEDWPRSSARQAQHASREREPYPLGSLAARRAVAEQEAPVCEGCGGPDDHYPDCRPASEGGTQPYPGDLAARRAVAEAEADPDVGIADPDLGELPIPPCDGGQIP